MPAIDTLVGQATWLQLDQTDIQTLQTLHNEVKTSAEQKNLPVLDAKQKALDAHLTALATKKVELATTITQYRAEIATLLEPFKQQLASLQTEVQGAQPATPPVEEPKKEPGFFAKLFNSDDPAGFFNSRKVGFGKAVVGTLAAIWSIFGMATAAKSIFSKEKSTTPAEKWPIQKKFEEFSNNVATWFGVPAPFGEGTKPASTETQQSTVAETADQEKRKELLATLATLDIKYKEAYVGERAKLLTTNALQMLVWVGQKFPWVRITSTIRTEEENNALHGSAEDSCHCYGDGFDIGRDLREPPKYSFEEVKAYVDGLTTPKTTLIHGDGDNKHLHIDTTLEKKDLANKWTKEKLDAQKVA